MTVSTLNSSAEFATNGVTTVFPIGFKFLAAADLNVTYTNAAGVTQDLVLGVDYTVSGAGDEQGGSITTLTALATGQLGVERDMQAYQPTSLRNQGRFFAETHEDVFDRLTMLVQQILGRIGRSLMRPLGRNYYDAEGRQIKNVDNPTSMQDAATLGWTSQYIAGVVSQIQGPINNAANIFYQAPDGTAWVVQDLSGLRGSDGIGYSAAGGVARTAEDKLREIVSRPDYATDAAFNAAAAGRPSIDSAGNLDAPIKKTNGDITTLRAIASQAAPVIPGVNIHVPSRPALIDQFIDGFFARGMLTAEPINVATERFITAIAAKGQSSISVSSTSSMVSGGGVTIRHVDGSYWPYIITGLTSTSLNIFPALRANVDTTSKFERLWYNRAHPGKFYMRYLAQRIAQGKEFENPLVKGRRVSFVEYGSGTTVALGGLTPTAGVTVNYFPAAPTGSSGSTSTPPRFTFETTAYVEFAAGTSGTAQTGLYPVRDYCDVTAVITAGSDYPFRVSVLDESGRLLAVKTITPPFVSNLYIGHRRNKISFFTGNATSVRFRFESASTSALALAVASIEAFGTQETQGKIVSKENAVIVGLGDSWIAGDAANNPERESIMTQLALEMPRATIINAGLGGNKIDQMLARFDTDVAVHNPDYVIINTGTNEAYNPYSSTYDPTSINAFIAYYLQLIGKIQAIGARPIILGPPALAQSDAEVPALAEWELLNRSRLQYIRLMRALSDRPNAS